MSIVTAIALFASWAASTFVGLVIGITYSEWGRQRGLEELLDALIKEETGHVK